MSRKARFLLLLFIAVAFFSHTSFAQQDMQYAVNPQLRSSRLIVWTIPETISGQGSGQAAQDQPPARPQQGQTSGSQDQMNQANQTFTGTMVRDGNSYVLKTADNVTYQLDDQDKASKFEGKTVKVTGSLDSTTNIIHLQAIELGA
ncbi:MAG TPA: DUF5818 domain-containing protein [Terriglobales bacterium]|nr:DUF5818 domain-containing protein [Terriglobales bacterium]